MPDHLSTQIRDHIVADLKVTSLKTVTGSRVHNFQLADLPGLAVYTLIEPVVQVNLAKSQERRLQIVLDLHATSTGDVEKDMDKYLVEVEIAMAADAKMGGLVLDSFLTLTTKTLTGEGDQRHALARLEYEALYRTAPTAPNVVP